jgi:hypothetical protein
MRSGQQRPLNELRDFLLAGHELPSGAWVRNSELLPALRAGLRVGSAFRRQGLSAALGRMPVRPNSPARCGQDPATISCARSAAARLLGLARTLTGRHWCLHEALAVCGGLRRLGFPVEVVIGYPLLEQPEIGENGQITPEPSKLHAWAALGHHPVTGGVDSFTTTYMELLRYPGV